MCFYECLFCCIFLVHVFLCMYIFVFVCTYQLMCICFLIRFYLCGLWLCKKAMNDSSKQREFIDVGWLQVCLLGIQDLWGVLKMACLSFIVCIYYIFSFKSHNVTLFSIRLTLLCESLVIEERIQKIKLPLGKTCCNMIWNPKINVYESLRWKALDLKLTLLFYIYLL